MGATAASLIEAIDLIRKRHISIGELVNDVQEAVHRQNPIFNAFISVDEDALRSTARDADGHRVAFAARPLHGIPISLKDLYDVRGTVTTAGSAAYADDAPATRDSQVWAGLRRAGALFLAKANLDELAYSPSGQNERFGDMANPWNVAYSPGGSSGGSAVAVALGMGFGSVGSDTGGSVRIPAAMCGVTGLKPTFQHSGRRGMALLSWTFDHPGLLARTAADCRVMLPAIRGRESADLAARAGYRPRARSRRRRASRAGGIRLGILTRHLRDADKEVATLVDAALRDLERLGLELTELTLSGEEQAIAEAGLIVRSEAATIHRRRWEERRAAFGERAAARLERGMQERAVDYAAAKLARRSRAIDLLGQQTDVDLVVGPTLPMATPTQAAFTGYDEAMRARIIRFTYPFNITGQPAISIACGFDPRGMPVGMQLAARPWEEDLLLQVAEAYQSATDWHTRRPPNMSHASRAGSAV
jgi:aspartyl-tRNA(Asn)/glutamyl-tRNA(Gln) amidotransferase subunit A